LTDIHDPGSYRFWIDEHVRFADLDPLGHANNGAIGAYFEAARVALFDACGNEVGSSGRSVVLARIAIDFRAELRRDARLRVGAKVTRIGRTSVNLASAVFAGDVLAAGSEAVCVLFDLATRRPAEVPDELRARLLEVAG
jgi:acyl-CoA thioester hydrolase